ncbi:MAG: methyltransferase domain-containing protein [Candidatus Marinimicrobia bacterium]|nr:methyltransferase domain-containing protein [candidate division WOR-3 bacterium]MCK4445835.1 methyltransferase domain-containing protein [Candidatus Neomarinimicrobiota bacterium]
MDLGGGNGEFLVKYKDKLNNFDIYIADIDNNVLKKASSLGFKTVLLKEDLFLPFENNEWDIVFCNSVIEHVTGPKQKVIYIQETKKFKDIANKHQIAFAKEINRIGKSYFVQTPHKNFPVESHTQFPLADYFNRPMQVRLIKFLNSFWIKKTQPDWNLLDKHDMQILFPEANIIVEKFLGFSKSIIAIKF